MEKLCAGGWGWGGHRGHRGSALVRPSELLLLGIHVLRVCVRAVYFAGSAQLAGKIIVPVLPAVLRVLIP